MKMPSGRAGFIATGISRYVEASGHGGVVLGVSGGIDSAVCLALCVKALGKKRVLALVMPNGKLGAGDIGDAVELCRKYGVEWRRVEIGGVVRLIGKTLESARGKKMSRVEMGNVAARVRMIFLYGAASGKQYLVLGTGNKSELLLGYFTKYGDGGVDLLPLGDLYKTEVKALARDMGIPEKIVRKKPSPNLWQGQTDEGELGLSYEFADSVLSMFLEGGMDGDEIIGKTGNAKDVKRIYGIVKGSSHKRVPPRILSMETGVWE